MSTVNHPKHYNVSSIECIDVAECFNFNLGNAIKYIWRCEHKGNKKEDLKKAVWYIQRELQRDASSVVEQDTPNVRAGGSIPSRLAS